MRHYMDFSTVLSGRRKQFLLGCAIVALPFLSFVWNGIWESAKITNGKLSFINCYDNY